MKQIQISAAAGTSDAVKKLDTSPEHVQVLSNDIQEFVARDPCRSG